jgi:hypothetical protein
MIGGSPSSRRLYEHGIGSGGGKGGNDGKGGTGRREARRETY